MQGVPDAVVNYLSTKDALVRARINAMYPNLGQMLADAATRSGILHWLSTEAEKSTAYVLITSSLEMLHSGTTTEAAIVSRFVQHPDSFVRMAAFEFLLELYTRTDSSALLSTFQRMLSDESDNVRSLAAHYIENTGVTQDIKELLQNWHQQAMTRGLDGTDSYQRIDRILKSQ